jgi:amino acid transporter
MAWTVFDLVLFTACAIVGLDSVAFAAQAGAQAITWLAISLALFLIPYGMLVAELGSAFPVEGSTAGPPGCRPPLT